MRPSEVVRRSADYLARHGVESPRETAEALLMHLLRTDRAGIYARSHGLDTGTARMFGRALCQRCHGTPLQHLTGEQQFLDLVLTVTPGVFVPRPETEGLVMAAVETLDQEHSPTVADVGTGTGAIALAIKSRRPDASVIALDRSSEAVEVARSNALRLDLQVDVRQGDLLDPLPTELRGAFDLIVSNPPYVTREEFEDLPAEVKREPYEALVGGTDMHDRLAREATEWLRPSGWLVLEIGASQGEQVRALMADRFDRVDILPDLAGRDRVVRGRLRSPVE